MSTAGSLTDRSKKDLAQMARRRGVRGWDSLSKEDLVKALMRASSKTKPSAKLARLAAKQANKAVVKPAVKSVAKTLGKSEVKEGPRPAAKSPKPPKAPGGAALPSTATPGRSQNAPAVLSQPIVNGKPSAGANANGMPPAKPVAPPSQAKSSSSAPPAKTAATPSQPTSKADPKSVVKPTAPVVIPAKEQPKEPPKDQASPKAPTGPTKDRIIMAVHDPYWLHVYWELSAQSVQRAEAALKQDWYGARLIIRLYDVTSQDTTSTSETPIRDIPIESDGSNWYINVQQPPRQYRADLGYLSKRGYLFVLARSNVVTPPKAGSSEVIDATWNMDTKKAERILAMSTGFESSGNPDLREVFEERLKKSLGAPKETGFGTGATPPGSLKKFFFEIDAKLIVFGRTDPTAHLTLGNDPIKLGADGTFVMSFSLPDSRQIIPAVATSSDGVEERTIVLAVERNTKYLDPMIHDQMNEI